MRTPIFRSIAVWLLLNLLAAPAHLWAWGNTGHEAVACVAWKQMDQATKDRVSALLKKVPTLHTASGDIPGYAEWVHDLPAGTTGDRRNMLLFMRAATWADSIKHHGLQDSDTPPPGPPSTLIIGFSDTYSHGYLHFIDTGFAPDGTKIPDTPVPNVATEINLLREHIGSQDGDLLKAYELVWLEHLLGDIHQPLHGVVRLNEGSGDRGGNLVNVKLAPGLSKSFVCPVGTAKLSAPRELHAFWDDLPGTCDAVTGLGPAETFAKPLPLFLLGTQLPGADRVQETDPMAWANASLLLAEKDVYVAPIGDGLQPDDGTGAYVITAAYYKRALADAKDSVALAGARLAKLLNENLK